MRFLTGLVILAVAAVFALCAIAWRPPIAPITSAAAMSFPAELIAQGDPLAAAGNCAAVIRLI
jgi:hypothetical protein